MRPIADILCDENLRLIPANLSHITEIIQAVEETGDEIFQAMPWLELDEPIAEQIKVYLQDVARYGAGGLSYHWAVFLCKEFAGLIALDYTSHLIQGHWNLGYWICPKFQRQGIAGRSIDAVLDWIGRGGLTSVEIAVNPANIAGVKTAKSAAFRWNGHILEQQVRVEVAGQEIDHKCWLIPRLPLEDSK
ncbi:MAG: GNAT family N-acetyltransferase [Candidatus Thermoplasmatota archaeon]|nr:GNAT family N-acetyltransferase [Candidatus Thermoplasmatota archaeon]